ncbi:MAG: MBOAT family protein [Schwartzia succinivorans]|jgi:D-alanyl-lipoteichoic acid acyltransferase DltB (MBOAT superfamily)|nr:MBOAT family protein [Schwartzia succinivorans]
MNFNSSQYAIFLPLVFILYWWLPHRFRWGLLLVASYYFYMSWNPQYVVLILGTTIVSYISAILLERLDSPQQKRLVIVVAGLICLGVLFVFKYFNFISESVAYVCAQLAIPLHPITLQVLLPVGISFYTFQTLSYVIDVYKGKVKAEHHFGQYATFISFFPQLVAGPIERTQNLLPQIKSVKTFGYNEAVYGLRLMAWGFFKKLVVADNAALIVDNVYGSLDKCTGLDLLLAVFLFTLQIYCDFSGYSDIAIGSARILGIKLMTNFKSPYWSGSLKEFWGRWHISLSTWFRDYLYIPLGGSRCSTLQHNINIMITFLVSGLWHGANWTFVFWGGIHGAVQVIENLLGLNKVERHGRNRILSAILIFTICNVAWVFFRSRTISDAFYILGNIIIPTSGIEWYLHSGVGIAKSSVTTLLIPILMIFAFDYVSLKKDVLEWLSDLKTSVRWGIYIVIIFWTILKMPLETSSFIYFQF